MCKCCILLVLYCSQLYLFCISHVHSFNVYADKGTNEDLFRD